LLQVAALKQLLMVISTTHLLRLEHLQSHHGQAGQLLILFLLLAVAAALVVQTPMDLAAAEAEAVSYYSQAKH
jgi:hypothetical protein